MPELTFDRAFQQMPVIAILRGLTPGEAPAVGRALVSAGITLMEIPLNTTDALAGIAALRDAVCAEALVGAGTVLSVGDVSRVAAAGATFVVSPNTDVNVIRQTKEARLISMPGVATPTEMFAGLQAGADLLKIFPTDIVSPGALRALRAVVPPAVRIVAVGDVSLDTVSLYRAAGASGVGLGRALYRPGLSAAEVGERASAYVRQWNLEG